MSESPSPHDATPEVYFPDDPATPATPRLNPSRTPTSPPTVRRPVRSGLVYRTLARFWVALVVCQVIFGLGAAYLIQNQVRPTYEATAGIYLQPRGFGLRTPEESPAEPVDVTVETEAAKVGCPAVLTSILADPTIAALPEIRESEDAELQIRRMLKVETRPGSRIIAVSVRSTRAQSAALLVNTIVSAYLEMDIQLEDELLRRLTRAIDVEAKELQVVLEEKKSALIYLATGSDFRPDESRPSSAAREKVSLARLQQWQGRLDELHLARVRTEATLNAEKGREPKAEAERVRWKERVEQLELQLVADAAAVKALSDRIQAVEDVLPRPEQEIRRRFLEEEIRTTQRRFDALQDRLGALRERGTGVSRPAKFYDARVNNVPALDRRPTLHVLAQLGLLAALLGVAFWVEARSSSPAHAAA